MVHACGLLIETLGKHNSNFDGRPLPLTQQAWLLSITTYFALLFDTCWRGTILASGCRYCILRPLYVAVCFGRTVLLGSTAVRILFAFTTTRYLQNIKSIYVIMESQDTYRYSRFFLFAAQTVFFLALDHLHDLLILAIFSTCGRWSVTTALDWRTMIQIQSASSRFAREVVLVWLHARNFFHLPLAAYWATWAIDRLIVSAILLSSLAIVGFVAVDVIVAGAARMIL